MIRSLEHTESVEKIRPVDIYHYLVPPQWHSLDSVPVLARVISARLTRVTCRGHVLDKVFIDQSLSLFGHAHLQDIGLIITFVLSVKLTLMFSCW